MEKPTTKLECVKCGHVFTVDEDVRSHMANCEGQLRPQTVSR